MHTASSLTPSSPVSCTQVMVSTHFRRMFLFNLTNLLQKNIYLFKKQVISPPPAEINDVHLTVSILMGRCVYIHAYAIGICIQYIYKNKMLIQI